MTKSLIIIVTSLFLCSCNSIDKKFCSCVSVSKKLNRINNSILNGNNTNDTLLKAKKLLAEKKNLCLEYQKMAGDELKKKKNDCN